MQSNQALIGDPEIAWIKQYISNGSPTGNEIDGQRIWLDYIRPFVDEHFVDTYGSVAAVINPGLPFKVVLEAHADEIAWFVKRIGTDGFIHVESTGGTDPGVAPSKWVTVHTHKGAVRGVFGWPAVHIREMSDDAPKESSIFVCCGCESKGDAEALGIRVGDYITYDTDFEVLNGNHIVGRALDNRIGGFMLARLARLLRDTGTELPYSLYLVNCVQEEVGMKGAMMMAHSIQPSCAIVIDVTHDTTSPMINQDKEGAIMIGKGPVITKSAPIHIKLRGLLEKTAEDQKLVIQRAVVSKETGTDADAFAYHAAGIPTALLSLPLRYMHTTVETMHRGDIESGIRLLYHTLLALKPDFDFKYL